MSYLEDGFECEVTFAEGHLNVGVHEFPPLRMYRSGPLLKVGCIKFTAAYADEDLDDIFDLININQKISWKRQDGSHGEVWGWIQTVDLSQLVICGRHCIEITIEPSNKNESGIVVGPLEVAPQYNVSTTSAR